MARRKLEKSEDKWWVKQPRSSRICQNCKHKYSSHLDNLCVKLISRHPRLECTCRKFITEKDIENMKKRESETD